MISRNWKRIPYIAAAAASLSILLFLVYIASLVDKTASFLFYILIITLTMWAAGMIFGLVVIAFTTSLYIFAHFFQDAPISIIDLGMFVIVSSTIGYVIEKYRKTDMIYDLRKQLDEGYKNIDLLTYENSKLKKEIKLRDEFLSIVSHELKTPLTSMLLKIQVVLHSVRNVSLAKFSVQNLLTMLETAEHQVQRLRKMINDLLNTSLITTGKLDLDMQQSDLTELVREVAREFIEKIEKEGCKLTFISEQPILIYVDRVRIEQVVTNLLTNAIKYGKGKPIEVQIVKGNKTAKIVVKDRGLGIDPKYKDHIFGLYGRGTEDKTYRGLGVGLYITNQIVQAHHGRITVDTRLNHGSTFTVELPLRQSN